MSDRLSAAQVTAALAKVGAPTAPAGASKEVLGKLGHRVAQHLLEYREEPDLVFLALDEVGVSPENRLGADPNLVVLHARITSSFETDGYDPSRHLAGIVVHYRSEEGKKALIAFNQRFSQGRVGAPKIHPEKMKYGTLASAHLTLAVRCVAEGMVSPVSGKNLGRLVVEDEKLGRVVLRGLQYTVLKETIPVEAMQEISQWRNQDQNSNLAFHEFELVQSLVAQARKTSIQCGPKVNLGNICALVLRSAPVSLSPHAVSSVGRFVLQYFGSAHQELLVDLCCLHSALVDPQSLSVPYAIFDVLSKEANLVESPHLRQAIVFTMWTSEGAIARQRPQPDTAGLISTNEITSLAKNQPLVKQVEEWLTEARQTYLPFLSLIHI